MSAHPSLEQFLCRWGRDLMVQQGEPPCMTIATTMVVLHDPDDTKLSSRPIKLCDEHLRAIAEQSTPTTPDRIEGWAKFWDHMEQFKHEPGDKA